MPQAVTRPLRSRLYWLALLLLFSLTLPDDAAAQEDANLRVVVTSGDDGSPIPGAYALLLDPERPEAEAETWRYAGATDSDGLHEFSGVEPGRYILRISFVGHRTHLDTLTLEAGVRRAERITLELDVAELGEVVVEGERDITVGEVGIVRISDIDIARIPTPGADGDLGSYLQTLPGVVTGGDRGGNLFIRGGTPFQNHILVDNLRIYKPFHISNLFSAFSDDILQNVDLHAGGFGAEFLGATSAVIDINLRPGNMKRFRSSGALGSHVVSLQGEGPLVIDRHSIFMSGRHSLIEQSSPVLMGEKDPIRFYDLQGRYSFQGDNVSCNVTAIHSYDNGQINPVLDVGLTWTNTVFGGRCLSFDAAFARPIEVTVGYSAFGNSERTEDRTYLTSAVQEQYFSVDHAFQSWGEDFDYGFGLTFTKYDSELADRFSAVESFVDESAIMKAYVSTDLELSDNILMQPSIGSQMTIRVNPTIEPRLRVSWQPDGTRNHIISMAAGRYFQVTNTITDERDAGTVFTVLQPSEVSSPLQSALHGLLGYRMRPSRDIEVNVEGYVKSHRNIRVSKWNPVQQVEVETAHANGTTYGLDARVEYDRNPVYFYLGYGWSYIGYEAASGDLGAWVEEPVFSYSPGHDRRHKINSVASYEWQGFTTSLGWEFGSGLPYTGVYGFDLRVDILNEDPLRDSGTSRTLYSRPYGKRLPTYHRLDLSVSRSFELSSTAMLEANAGLINAYDRDNIFYYDANLLQRVNQTARLPYFSLKLNIN